MLRLTLLRHAKSSWDDHGLADSERPLAARGLRDAPEMGRRLAARNDPPGLIVSSPALRALATARAVAREIGHREDRIVPEPRLYLADAATILAVLRDLRDAPRHVMLVGHNPGFTDLANRLDDLSIDNLPTTAMLCVDFIAGRWAEVEPAAAGLVWLDYPKKRTSAAG
jgi:phosphohistidine phosphatase